MQITLRQLRSHAEYKACVALQKATWGEVFTEMVPPSILMVSQKIGGVAAGAFDEHDRLIGFVFGLTGVKNGRLVHWSDMLAVRPEARDLGIGKRLKMYQRELVQALGVEIIYWTFDPLVARNAHLNLNRLGAKIEEYVPDMYDSDSQSDLHRGLALDRFIVAWPISHDAQPENVEDSSAITREHFKDTIIANASGHDFSLSENSVVTHARVRIEIPEDIQAVKDRSWETAAQWQDSVRRACQFYFERGYRVAGFYRDSENGRCFYGIEK